VLFRSPASSLAVVVTLATAMGAAIATFSLVQSLVLDPLPFREPARLIAVWQAETSTPGNWLGTSLFNFVEWKKRARTLERVVAVRNTSLTLTDFEDGGTPLMQRVSHGYFELLGVDPLLGRTFTEDEDRVGGPLAVMLSAELWRQRFGGDPEVIGKRLTLDGRGYTIVGITPAGHENPVFGLVDRPQAFVALQAPGR
jgi:putative ABC transport system permease protein